MVNWISKYKRQSASTPKDKSSSYGMRLINSLLKWCGNVLFAALALLVTVVVLTRVTFSFLPALQPQLSRFLSAHLNANLQVEAMAVQWNGGEPWLSLHGLTLRGEGADVIGFSIDELELELSIRESLLNRMPVFTALELKGVNINLVQGDGAQWMLSGVQRIAGSSPQTIQYRKSKVLKWLALQEMVDIRNVRLHLNKANGESSHINGRYLTVLTDHGQKDLSARLEVGDGYLEVNGGGGFTDGRLSLWQGNAIAKDLDAEQLCALWSGCYDDVVKIMVELDTQWRYENEQWQLQGRAASSDIAYLDRANTLNHLSVQTELFMQGVNGSRWQLWLTDTTLENHLSNGTTYHWRNSWYLAGDRQQEYAVTVATKELDLNLLKGLLLNTEVLPGKAAKLLQTLNPRGNLHDLALNFYLSRQPFDFDLSARLDNVAVDAWKGAPSGGNVSGQLRMSLQQGYLDLDTHNFQLGFPKLFRDTWTYDTARGRLYWDVIDDFYILKSDDLALTGPEGSLKGKLRLDIPLKRQYDQTLDMALTVGMSNGDARYTPKYLPALGPMDDNLTHWLDSAIRGGAISEGGFIYNGALVDSKDPLDNRWGLFFDLHDAILAYEPQWPQISNLNGQVFVNDDRVEVLATSARTAGGQLDNLVARLPLNGSAVLQVNSQLKASGETLHYLLTQTPINQRMDGEAQKWQLHGSIDAELGLTLPLKALDDAVVDIRSSVNDFQFAIAEMGINIEKIAGELSFNSERGLNAQQLSAELFGSEVSLQIASEAVNKQLAATNINWSGTIEVPALQQWLKLDYLSVLAGKTDYHAALSLDFAEKSQMLQVNSELLGVTSELPVPLAKTADEPLPLALLFTAKGQQERLSIDVSGLGQVEMDMTSGSTLFTLGNRPELSMQLPASGQIAVRGSLDELNIDLWKHYFESSFQSPTNVPTRKSNLQSLLSRTSVEQLRIGAVLYDQQRWQDVVASLTSETGGTSLTIDGQTIKGELWLPQQKKDPWSLNVEHLYLAETNSKEGSKDVLEGVDLTEVPNMDVSISHLQVGDKTPVSVGFQLRHRAGGVKINNITGTLSGMKLEAFGDWVQSGGEQHSSLQGELTGADIKGLQKALGYTGILEAKESHFEARLHWLGSPLCSDVASLKGSVDLVLENGRLRKLEKGSSGALKFFGLFNTEALTRRLKLDFSDLYASGISFDQLRGRLNFNQGVITFDSPLVIEGPSSNFKLDGIIDTQLETLNLSLVVTLPVSANLPILSVLMGTAPQVAGIIFLADKLVGSQVNQLASIRYRITGSFNNPKMTLDRLFSSKTKQNQN